MKTLLRMLALSVCVVIPFQPSHAQAKSTAEAEVHHWIEAWTKAFEARDVNATMALYSPDVLAYDVTPPLQYVGGAAYRKDWEDYYASFKGPMHFEMRDLHIMVSGNLAIVEALVHVGGTPVRNAPPTDVWLRNTTVLRRENGRWLDIHDHVSVPADPSSGKAMWDLKP